MAKLKTKSDTKQSIKDPSKDDQISPSMDQASKVAAKDVADSPAPALAKKRDWPVHKNRSF